MSLFLPDGSRKLAHFIGNVVVSYKLILKDVLFSLDLKHNLKSMHKLAIQNNGKVTFSSDNYWMHDQHNGSLIGNGKACGNLYFQEIDKDRICNKTQNVVVNNIIDLHS